MLDGGMGMLDGGIGHARRRYGTCYTEVWDMLDGGMGHAKRRVIVLKMKCLGRAVGIPFMDRLRNADVRRRWIAVERKLTNELLWILSLQNVIFAEGGL